VRFPSAVDPGDAGWHIDSSFDAPDGRWFVNYRSRERGLLLLCLLSDLGVDDAPARILRGSHLQMPALLRPYGDDGVFGLEAPLPEPTDRVALMTGDAGDVFLCHPFLVHAASWPHRGSTPRFMAQPPISISGELQLDGHIDRLSPVARAVRTALDTCG
jgi:ectoine hydroxylase-related dioxygenase (phytanoyl-CoA dioxygenase family)